MSKKNLYLLSAVFLILFAIATQPVWNKYLTFGQRSAENQLLLSNISQPSQIIITNSNTEEQINLTSSDGWKVNDLEAGTKEINLFLQELANLQIDSLSSSNPEKFSEFGLKEGDGIKLTFNSDIPELIVGIQGNQSNTFYLKKAQEDKVYLIKGQLRNLVIGDVNSWRNKTMLQIDPKILTSLELNNQGNQLKVDKNLENRWVATLGSSTAVLDGVVSERMVDALTLLEAFGFANDEEKNSFINSFSKSTARLFDQEKNQLATITLLKSDTNWLATVNDNPQVYRLTSATVESFMLDSQEVFATE